MILKKTSYLLVLVFSLVFWRVASIQAQGAQLSLSTDNHQVEVDDQFEVNVNVNSVQNTLGTDIVVKYDPTKLELVGVMPGNLYQDFSDTDQALQAAQANGQVRLSGVADLNSGAVANGVFATLQFNPLAETTTLIEIMYEETDSTLSGIIPFEGDELNILTEAPESLEIEVISNNFFKRMWMFIKEAFSLL